jgi:4-amino-4-deoxy-L-arabinose transferase-like glycosyltransferase
MAMAGVEIERSAAPREAGALSVRDALLVALVAALLIVPLLGRHLIAYSGEARMALLARDMIERGVLFQARVEGQLYRNKPPLYPWSIALVSLPGGRVTEATAHAPVAVAAIATAVLTCLFGARLFGRRAGLWAGLILITGAGFFSHSQVLLPDMLVAAFTTAAAYAFWRAVSAPPGGLAMVGFYTAVAFAVFSKGPVGLLPLLVAAVWLWTEHGPRGLARLLSPAGLLVFAAITLAWLVPYLLAGTGSFGQTVLWGDWLSWYLGLPSPRRVGQFLLDGLVGFLPWSILLPMALAHVWRARRDRAARWVLLAFVVPLAVIVLSSNRLPIYLLPVYPMAAIIVAGWADRRGATVTRPARVLARLFLVGVVVALAVAPFVPDVRESGILQLPGFVGKAVPLVAGMLLLGGAFFWGLSRGRPALVVYGGAALMAVLLSVGVRLNDEAIERTQDFRIVAAALERHAAGGDMRLFSASLLLPVDFYVGRQLDRMWEVKELRDYLARPERPVALIDRRYWRDFEMELPPEMVVLEKIPIQGQELYIVRGGARG